MTEALRTESQEGSQTALNAGFIAVPNLVPHESTVPYKKNTFSGFRGRALALGLGGIGVFTAVGGALAQEPSIAPNPSLQPGESPQATDIITALVDPCATPTPEPSPTPIPTPIIGEVPGGGEIIAAVNDSNGDTLIITLDQELPSSAPSVEPDLPDLSPAPSENPQTALADPSCEPEQPTPEITPFEPIPVDPKADLLDVKAPEKIPTIRNIKSLVVKMFEKDNKISNPLFPFSEDHTLTKDIALLHVKIMEKGNPVLDKNQNSVESSKIASSVYLTDWSYLMYVANGDKRFLDLARDIIWFSKSNYENFYISYDKSFIDTGLKPMREDLKELGLLKVSE